MYTKARIAGHPIHPMLIAFPVTLYVLTVVSQLVYTGTNDIFWYRAALCCNIGGVAMAAVAAVPGLIDLLGLPSRSRARVTGLNHAAFNVLALVLFTVSAVLLYRHAGNNIWPAAGYYALDVTAPLVLSILGVLATVTAGWLGWTMVQTHHVGVKPTRFDRAGIPLEQLDDLDEVPAPEPQPTFADRAPPTLRH